MSEEVVESTEAPQSNEPLLDAAAPEPSEGDWFLMDGLKGQGDMPEFFKADKYKNLAEQAKAYTELEKKFGSFTGMPKDGYQLPEGLDADDELAKQVIEWGQKNNLNQAGFNDLMTLALAQGQAAEQANQEQELKKLGDNAPQRIKQVEVFLKEKMGESYDEVRDLVTNADDVLLVEKIMSAINPPKPVIEGGEHPQGLTWADAEKMLAAKDEHGNLLMSVDREHQRKYNALLRELNGGKDPYAAS